MLRDISPHPAWQRLLDLNAQIQEMTPRFLEIPTVKWNAAADRYHACLIEVRDDAELMRLLRAQVEQISSPDALRMLYEVLGGAVAEHEANLDALKADPRVRDVAGDLLVDLAIYLAEASLERTSITEDDAYEVEAIYAGDDIDDENRDFSRIGGVPTQTAATPAVGNAVFLLQVDLRALHQPWQHDGFPEVIRRWPLPADGLLQVFHTTMGDSVTDPHLPGGGATVVYCDEEAIRHRGLPDRAQDAYPVSAVSASALPTFRTVPNTSDEALNRVLGLQEDAWRAARNGSYRDDYLREYERNPFTARAGAVTHMFGLQALDYDLDSEELALLHERLPLAGTHDTHLLLLNIAADHTYDSVFGDDGRLEIWIRASDVRQARFDKVVSFLRSQ